VVYFENEEVATDINFGNTSGVCGLDGSSSGDEQG
jgi:hypothetical protein